MARQELLTALNSYGVEYLDEHDAWWPLHNGQSYPTEQAARNGAERFTRQTLTTTRVVLIETYVSVI